MCSCTSSTHYVRNSVYSRTERKFRTHVKSVVPDPDPLFEYAEGKGLARLIFTDGNRAVAKLSSKSDHLGGTANMDKTRDEIWLTRGIYADIQTL